MGRWPPALSGLVAAALLPLVTAALAVAQSSPQRSPEPPAAFKLLVDQIAGTFVPVDTVVIQVTGRRVTLEGGRSAGVQPGLELIAVREGRELYHPTTKALLGRAEERLGRLVVVEVAESYSVATLVDGRSPQPGDRARLPSAKARLTLVSLSSGLPARLVDAALQELIQALDRTGRVQLVFGDQVVAWLGRAGIPPEEFLRGKGVGEAGERFKVSHLLVVHFTREQGKPFMDVRLFSPALEAPLIQSALFVPPTVRPRSAQEFSGGKGGGAGQVERRSLLARLLSGDFEPNAYSASAAQIPLKLLATFPFVVVSMDVAVSPQDKLPRIALTDGQRVFLYRLENQTLHPEWTHDRRMLGNILSVQLADIDGDNVLDVVVNRQEAKAGMLSYILTTRNGRPATLAEDEDLLLLAVDEQGEGVSRVLWGYRPDAEKFFRTGRAERWVLKGGKLVAAGPVALPDSFRLIGGTMAAVSKGAPRVLAFVDEQRRLRIASGPQELWRSLTPVGGGLALAQVKIVLHGMVADRFFKMEPNPVAIDLDGDGLQEVVVPVNEEDAGRMAVVFKGPAGFRMQVVNSGFEGMVTGLGAISGDPPSLVAAVVKRGGFLGRDKGETQLVMTVAE